MRFTSRDPGRPMYHHLQFDGLDETDQRVHQHRDDLGYVTVHEVLDRNRNEQLGRVYFNAVDLAPFLTDAEPDEGGELGDLSDVSDGPSSEDLAHAASRWVRHVVATNMVGRAEAKFKASLWRPKGEGQFHSARFVCRNLEVDDTPPLAVPAPEPVTRRPFQLEPFNLEATTPCSAITMTDLGDHVHPIQVITITRTG